MVLNTDLAPTIAALAGAEMTHEVDGRSLVPLLAAQSPPAWRKRYLVEHWQSIPGEMPTYSAVRTTPEQQLAPNLLYVEYRRNGATIDRELYDMNPLPLGPYQLHSLHDAPHPVRQLQRQLMRSWLQLLRFCKGEGCRRLEE
jgi:hypothetical protein